MLCLFVFYVSTVMFNLSYQYSFMFLLHLFEYRFINNKCWKYIQNFNKFGYFSQRLCDADLLDEYGQREKLSNWNLTYLYKQTWTSFEKHFNYCIFILWSDFVLNSTVSGISFTNLCSWDKHFFMSRRIFDLIKKLIFQKPYTIYHADQLKFCSN